MCRSGGVCDLRQFVLLLFEVDRDAAARSGDLGAIGSLIPRASARPPFTPVLY